MFFIRCGKIKYHAHANRTYTDIDERKPIPITRIYWIARVLGIKPEWIEYDRTKHGWHIIVQWPKGTFDTRCPHCNKAHHEPFAMLSLQTIIGSDFRREALNYMRLMSLRRDAYALGHWNILYQRKLYR